MAVRVRAGGKAWALGSGDQLKTNIGWWLEVFVTCRYVEEDHRRLLYQMYAASPTFKIQKFVVQDSRYLVDGYLIDVWSI